MATWERKCERFKEVRSLINKGDETPSGCMRIMYAIETCCDELTPDSEEDWAFYNAFRDFASEIHEEVEYMPDDNYDSCAVFVNSYLNEFYDLCDSARVWLEV